MPPIAHIAWSAPIRVKGNHCAVGRAGRAPIIGRVLCQLGLVGPVNIHDVDLVVPVPTKIKTILLPSGDWEG